MYIVKFASVCAVPLLLNKFNCTLNVCEYNNKNQIRTYKKKQSWHLQTHKKNIIRYIQHEKNQSQSKIFKKKIIF